MQKTLIPIRMFKPRSTDIKPVEYPPVKKTWVLTGDELAQKFAALGADYSSLEYEKLGISVGICGGLTARNVYSIMIAV